MLSKTVELAINAQIQEEFTSFYAYLSMSTYCSSLNLRGFAHWFKIQADEERGHALKLLDYVVERGGHVELRTLQQPEHRFKSVTDVIQKTLAHERKITACIHKLYEIASKEKDYATQVMLQWFIEEQVEEEASVEDILKKLELISEKSSAILYLDKELKKRGGK